MFTSYVKGGIICKIVYSLCAVGVNLSHCRKWGKSEVQGNYLVGYQNLPHMYLILFLPELMMFCILTVGFYLSNKLLNQLRQVPLMLYFSSFLKITLCCKVSKALLRSRKIARVYFLFSRFFSISPNNSVTALSVEWFVWKLYWLS